MNLSTVSDYKTFLNQLLDKHKRVGLQNALARAMNCQSAYLSRVLRGDAHLSSDQIQLACAFFGLNELEREYWIFLNLENRAGNRELKAFFKVKLNTILEKHELIANRIESTKSLDGRAHETYYSQWHMAAVHMAALLPTLKTAEKISRALQIPLAKTNEILLNLEKIGILKQTKNGFEVRQTKLHLGANFAQTARHHTNWRMKTIERLNNGLDNGTHYTSVITCSKEDERHIREEFIACIQKARTIVASSANEGLYHYAIDFYPVTTAEHGL